MKHPLHSSLYSKSVAFTLVEVLIAVSLFGMVGMTGTTVYLNLSRGQQGVTSRNLIYDDAQFILDQLTREVSGSAVDYEEYYNQVVIGGKPGMNFGQYASKFYYNATALTEGCPEPSPKAPAKVPNCNNVGKNPTQGNFPEKSNAFYEAGTISGLFCDGFEPIFAVGKNHACVKELFLINPDGTRKTFIAAENVDWGNSKISHVLSQAAMVVAEDTKKNILPHLFHCALDAAGNDTLCSKPATVNTLNLNGNPGTIDLSYPDPADLTGDDGTPPILNPDVAPVTKAYNQGKNFVPFTPSRVNIKSIKFFISPAEDPHKAFEEQSENAGTLTTVHQSQVTIVLTVEPVSNVKNNTKYPSLTVQTTVTPGMLSEVKSYPPQMQKTP